MLIDVKQGAEGESLGRVERDLGLRVRGSVRGKYIDSSASVSCHRQQLEVWCDT